LINPNIIQYIRQYRSVYTREAIDRQLAAAGYDPAEVEQTWWLLENEMPTTDAPPEAMPPMPGSRWGDDPAHDPPKSRRFANTPAFWFTLLGFIVLSYGLPILLGWLLSLNFDTQRNAGLFSTATFGLLQLGGIVGGLLLLGRRRPAAMGLLIGVLTVVVVLPIVSFCILFGICLVGFGGGFGLLGGI
jgi:hypothetical protein